MFIFFALFVSICCISNIISMQQGNQGQQQQNPPQFHIPSHLNQQAQQSAANKEVVKHKINGKKFCLEK